MALSFVEKRKIQGIIEDRLKALAESGVAFAAKRTMQKELEDAFAKLNETIAIEPEKAAENEMLAALIAGKFNGEPPEKFLKILKTIIDEIKVVEPVKAPTIAYIEANREKVGAIMESALSEVFGKLWEKAG